jgi:hypothetical protein
VAYCAVVVNFGESQIFKGHVPQLFKRGIDRRISLSYIF